MNASQRSCQWRGFGTASIFKRSCCAGRNAGAASSAAFTAALLAGCATTPHISPKEHPLQSATIGLNGPEVAPAVAWWGGLNDPQLDRIMADALSAAHKPVQMVVLKDEDHRLSRSDTRQQMLEAAVGFIEANNPADPSPTRTASSQP